MQPPESWQDEQRGTPEPLGDADTPIRSGDGTDARDGSTMDDGLRETVRSVLFHAVCAVRFADVAGNDRRRLIQHLCGEARLRGVRAEQLIVALKEAWYRLPEARRLQHPNAEDVLGAVITACIEEYYGPVTRRRVD